MAFLHGNIPYFEGRPKVRWRNPTVSCPIGILNTPGRFCTVRWVSYFLLCYYAQPNGRVRRLDGQRVSGKRLFR